jgi:hypothetical protein
MGGWAKSAVCEKILHDHSILLERDHRNQSPRKDGPDELVLPPITAPETLKDVVVSMDDALKSSGTDDEKQVLSNEKELMSSCQRSSQVKCG